MDRDRRHTHIILKPESTELLQELVINSTQQFCSSHPSVASYLTVVAPQMLSLDGEGRTKTVVVLVVMRASGECRPLPKPNCGAVPYHAVLKCIQWRHKLQIAPDRWRPQRQACGRPFAFAMVDNKQCGETFSVFGSTWSRCGWLRKRNGIFFGEIFMNIRSVPVVFTWSC